MMLLRTSYFLLSASILLVGGVADGRRLTDPIRSLESDLLVVTDVTQPILFDVEEKHQMTRHIEVEEDEPQQKAGNDGHEFETATHSPDSFNASAITDGIDEKDIFTPAASLDIFKNVDPTKFKWMNPDNIKPGATTCGFLYTTLGAEPGVNYPVIKVYICMKFATNQPAPKGNIVVHCGGPSSVSNCIDIMGSENDIGKDNAANYNIISIDQRGMGRSWPSFYHEECNSIDFPDSNDDGKYNATILQDYLNDQKDIVESCWACTNCDYQFNIKQPDGDMRSFHFLEYSGTRQLAEDLNRFRVLIEATKLSLYGISYGTTVMGTYATIFPSNVDKFILDGSVTPYNTAEELSRSAAVGYQLRYNYLKYTCWAARIENPDSCPVKPDDIGNCVENAGALSDIIQNWDSFTDEELDKLPISISDIPDIVIKGSSLSSIAAPIDFLLYLLTYDPITMGKICSTDNEDLDTLVELIKIFAPPQKRGIGLGIDCDKYDQPSDDDEGICFDYEPWYGDTISAVTGQDYAGGVSAYDDDVYINHVLGFQDEYGWEYNFPLIQYGYGLANNYYWPKNVPLPILGNPLVNGIVTGQLYDPATPYIWTSQMREHFPYTSLLTSQSIFHGIETSSKLGFTDVETTAEGPCQKYVVKYLENGVIDWTDGTVCGEKFPYFDGEIRK